MTDLAPTIGTEVLVLKCRGGFHGEVVNRRYLRVRCRCRRCKVERAKTYHLFDLFSGRWTSEYPDDERPAEPGEE